MSFEAQLIEYCAPTLAGVKTGSLFRHLPSPGTDTAALVDRWDRALARKGVRLILLGHCPAGRGDLVYVYRAAALARTLNQPDVADFLSGQGYAALTPAACLELLSRRVSTQPHFPHEIGIFLGYPLCDVLGFMAHGGQNYRCSGCWKVYGDPRAAQVCFDRYRRCTALFRRLHRKGAAVERLTVAA